MDDIEQILMKLASMQSTLAQVQVISQTRKRIIESYEREEASYRSQIEKLVIQKIDLENELRRLVNLIENELIRPDGSTPDTTAAHALLGDFRKEDAECS